VCDCRSSFPLRFRAFIAKAAKWYRAQNDPIDAIYHLLAGKSWEEAAVLIEKVALHELKQSGEDSRLLCVGCSSCRRQWCSNTNTAGGVYPTGRDSIAVG